MGCALMMMAAAVGGTFLGDCGGSGASLAFTSEHPTIRKAVALAYEEGRIGEAEALLDAMPDEADTRQAVAETRETLRRLRHEYTLTPDDLLTKIRPSIADVSAADLERWRELGQAQARTIDGKLLYFRREPGIIWRFCEEAQRRRGAAAGGDPSAADPKRLLIRHLEEVVKAGEAGESPEVIPVRHRIRYTVTAKPKVAVAKGDLVRCWLPFPQEYRQQGGVRLIKTSPEQHVVAPGWQESGGAMQRTVYLERRVGEPGEPLKFEEEFEYVCAAYYPRLDPSRAKALPADWGAKHLGERPPHIVFTPEIRDLVTKVVGEERNPLEKARRIYMHLVRELRWCPEEEYTIVPSLCLKALPHRRGDCGVQSMLFIAMCRAAGIPARWQSGWETKPEAWNMHDWAEFYVAPWGWLPADVSYGLQESDNPKVREFYFGHLDAYRMIVNLDYGCPLQPAKESLRSEPADFQRGEVEINGRNLYFDEWDYSIKIEWDRAAAR